MTPRIKTGEHKTGARNHARPRVRLRKMFRRNRRRARSAITPRTAVPGGIRGGGGPRLDRVSIVVLQSEGGGIGEEAVVEVDRPGDLAFMTTESRESGRPSGSRSWRASHQRRSQNAQKHNPQRQRRQSLRATWGSPASEDAPASGRQDVGHEAGRPVRRRSPRRGRRLLMRHRDLPSLLAWPTGRAQYESLV